MDKRVGILVAGAILFGMVVGAAGKSVKAEKSTYFDVVRARRLEIVNEQNVPLIVLSQTNGKTALAFECRDSKGNRYGDIVLGATPGEGQTLLFHNSTHKSYAALKVDKAGIPILELRDPRGKILDILAPK